MCKAKELSSNLVDALTTIRNTANEVNKQMSQIDKKIIDLQHEIELNKFDVCRGFKKFKQLQNVLIERRSVKDEVELIQPLIAYVGNIEKSVNKIHNVIIEREINFQHRKYTPRILK